MDLIAHIRSSICPPGEHSKDDRTLECPQVMEMNSSSLLMATIKAVSLFPTSLPAFCFPQRASFLAAPSILSSGLFVLWQLGRFPSLKNDSGWGCPASGSPAPASLLGSNKTKKPNKWAKAKARGKTALTTSKYRSRWSSCSVHSIHFIKKKPAVVCYVTFNPVKHVRSCLPCCRSDLEATVGSPHILGALCTKFTPGKLRKGH